MSPSLFAPLASTTPELSLSNLEKLKALFPHLVTESADGLAVDWDLMRQEFSKTLVEGEKERYRLEWPGKREALFTANRPTTSTLRPDRESSKDFNTTQNLYIEGDNLEALKLLRQSYLGKIKMIYIDPPYNTGHDFVYNDDFAHSKAEELTKSGLLDAEGRATIDKGAFKENTESNGRYHSDWLSMMYPRLKLARDLLTDDGVIFISIDDNEQANLKKLCDEIFGEEKFIGNFKWNKTSKAPTLSKKIRGKYEYVHCYEKDDVGLLRGPASYNTMGPLLNKSNAMSKLIFKPGELEFLFEDGVYGATAFSNNNVILHNDIVVKDGKNYNTCEITARFKWTQHTLGERIQDGQRIIVKTNKFSTFYYTLSEGEDKFIAPSDVLNKEECNVLRNDEGYAELRSLFDDTPVFDYTKPISLLKYLVAMQESSNGLILDFFSGSGTTAHAVMQLNAEDGGKRKFILVQLPEVCDEKSEASKAGYKNICEIGKERIRRAGAQIQATCEAEGKAVPDVGFRVLKVDSSNLVEAKRKPEETTVEDLFVGTVKAERSEEDLLFQAIRETGSLPLTCAIEKQSIQGVTVWIVDGGNLVACLAEKSITAEVAASMAELMPAVAVFREDGFANDTVKANVVQQFVQRGCKASLRVI